MNIEEFIKQFALQFDDVPESEFQAGTIYRDIDGWSSLVALSIIAMADEDYNVKLTGDDIRNSETIEDVYNKVYSKKHA